MRFFTYISSLFTPEESSLQDILTRERKQPQRFRIYTSRTPTQDALNPDTGIKVCANEKCKIRFHPRLDSLEDNPSLCLQCNREGWSRLCKKPVPDTSVSTPVPMPTTLTPQADILPLRRSVK